MQGASEQVMIVILLPKKSSYFVENLAEPAISCDLRLVSVVLNSNLINQTYSEVP